MLRTKELAQWKYVLPVESYCCKTLMGTGILTVQNVAVNRPGFICSVIGEDSVSD